MGKLEFIFAKSTQASRSLPVIFYSCKFKS